MSEQRITCQECGDVFAFSEAEQAFYAEKGLAAPPKRCKACRQARKAARGGGGGGGGFGNGPRRYSGDVNEYRSPMGGGNAGQDWARGGGDFRRGGNRRNGNGGGPPRAYGNTRERESNEYRSPAFPESRREGGPRRNGNAAPSSGGPRSPRPPSPRPERPKYDITCAECGAAAQVPFKPLEGRQVFCQNCYRARRATPHDGAVAAVDVAGTDSGIVE